MRRREANEEKRRENDLVCIRSVVAFRSAIRAVFQFHGKQTVSVYDLHRDVSEDSRGVNGYFTTNLIRGLGINRIDVSLKDCLQFLKDEEAFEFFRAKEILEFPYTGSKVDEVLTPIIQAFYDKTLPGCRFENAYFEENGFIAVGPMEELMASIFRKYRFPTPQQYLTELLWMDTAGIADAAKSRVHQTDLLRDKILDSMDGHRQAIKTAVLAHLRSGIH